MKLSGTAPSKINLFLRVTGCRADGYHTIESFFLPLSHPADRVEITDGTDVRLTSDNPDLPTDDGNIAVKAARRFAEATGIKAAWQIHLTKQIPVAAGMGGGSSDAATVLSLLNNAYGAPLAPTRLAALALSLGADVPFFLHPQAGWVSGIGEIFEPRIEPTPPLALVCVSPEFPVSARWSYTHLAAARSRITRADFDAALNCGDPQALAAALRNDLAAALYKKFPLLIELKNALLAAGAAGVEITGSGPTLVALFPDTQAAARLQVAWSAGHTGVKVIAVR